MQTQAEISVILSLLIFLSFYNINLTLIPRTSISVSLLSPSMPPVPLDPNRIPTPNSQKLSYTIGQSCGTRCSTRQNVPSRFPLEHQPVTNWSPRRMLTLRLRFLLGYASSSIPSISPCSSRGRIPFPPSLDMGQLLKLRLWFETIISASLVKAQQRASKSDSL